MNIRSLTLIFLILGLVYLHSTCWFRLALGRYYEQRGDHNQAAKIYKKFLRKSQLGKDKFLSLENRFCKREKTRVAKMLGGYFFDRGEIPEAKLCYRILEDSGKADAQSYYRLYLLTQEPQKLFALQAENKEPLLFDERIQGQLNFPLWQYQLGVFLAQQNKFREAKRVLESLAAEYPYLSCAHYRLGQVNKALGLWDLAEEGFYKDDFDIVGMWNFDEGLGTIAKDASGRFNNAFVHGARWAQDEGRKVLQFNGEQDYVQIADNKIFQNASNLSVSFWIKILSWSKTYSSHPLQKFYDISSAQFCFYLDGEYLKDKMTVLATINNVWAGASPTSRSLDLNKWYHIVWTYSEERGGMLYVDGVPQGKRSTGGKLALTPGVPIIIGSGGFYGFLDDISIFNRELTPEEARQLS